MHYALQSATGVNVYAIFESVQECLDYANQRFEWGEETLTTHIVNDECISILTKEGSLHPCGIRCYPTLPKYRIDYVMAQAATYTLHDTLESVVKSLLRFAIDDDYPVRLQYLLHYACFQTWDDTGEYVCSCFRHNELQAAWNEVLGK